MNTHSGQLERWLGTDQVEQFSRAMRGWYGPPIALAGVPGNVHACGDGDFTGRIVGGAEASLRCFAREFGRRLRRATSRHGMVQSGGFGTFADILISGKNGRRETINFVKTIASPGNPASVSLWRQATTPAAGAAAGAAPGGTVPTSATTGAAYFMNARAGEKSFVTSSVATASAQPGAYLMYDRIFAVAKTMNSTATEAVTGVPTRYQSATPLAADYAGGNFLFPECGTVLANTAHNWTVCTYTDQDGNAGATLPSQGGLASNAAGRNDFLNTDNWKWFFPLATGDNGVKALTQMQCDALVATGAIDFVIGHPLAWIPMLVAAIPQLSDGIKSAFNLSRVFDDACLAFLGLQGSGANTAQGTLEIVSG